MVLRKGYKISDLGIIPEEWITISIPEVISNKDGIKIGPFGSQLKKELLTDNGYKVYGQENVYEKNMSIGERFIDKSHFDKLKSCEINSGDFLISMMGTVGKTMIVPKTFEPGIMDSHLLRLRLNEKVIHPELMQHHFSSKLLLDQVMSLSVGGIMAGLSSKIIRQIILPLPPTKAEQTAIATALSDMDNLIAGLEQLIAKKKAIKQGAMQELLRPKEGWMVKKLRDVGDVKMCRRIFNHETKPEGAIPFYKIGTFGKEPDAYITEELYNSYRQKFAFPNKGDILISAAGTIGRTIIYDGKPAYFQDSNIVWIDNNESLISNEFLFYILKIIKYNTEGGTIQRLYNAILLNAEFFCPPKSEQNRITEVLSDMDDEIMLLEANLEKYKLIKQGMMQELLTGKTRLV